MNSFMKALGNLVSIIIATLIFAVFLALVVTAILLLARVLHETWEWAGII